MAGIVFLIYAWNFDGPFSSLSRDRFSKKHNIKQPNVNKPELPLEIISKEMGQNNIVPTLGKERKSHTSSQHFVWRFARAYGHAWNRTLHHDAAP